MSSPVTPAARVVSKDQPRPLALAFRILALGYAAAAVAIVGAGIYRTHLFGKLRDRGFDYDGDYEGVIKQLEAFFEIMGPVRLGIGVVVLVGWALVVRSVRRGTTGVLAISALITSGIAVGFSALWMVAGLFDIGAIGRFFYDHKWVELVAVLITTMSPALALAFFSHRAKEAPAWAWICGAALLISVGYMFITHFDPPTHKSSLWNPFVFSTLTYGIGLAGAGAIAWLSWSLGARVPAMGAATRGEAWAPAARGLDIYAKALTWRLLLTLAAMFMLFMAYKARSLSFIRMIGWMLPLVIVVTSSIMTWGVFEFSRQPEGSRGKPPAVFASAVMTLAVLLDLAVLVSAIKLLDVDAQSRSYAALADAQETAENAKTIGVWGMALALSAFIALLASFHAVAKELESDELANKCISTGVLVVIAGFVAVAVRLWLVDAKRIDEGTLILAMFAILAAALVAVISYLSLVGQVKERLDDEILGVDDPTANDYEATER